MALDQPDMRFSKRITLIFPCCSVPGTGSPVPSLLILLIGTGSFMKTGTGFSEW
jgi:hypothetical protein